LSGFGTQAGEFRDVDANGVVAFRVGVGKSFKVFGRFAGHGFGSRLMFLANASPGKGFYKQARTIPELTTILTVFARIFFAFLAGKGMFHGTICLSILCRLSASGIVHPNPFFPRFATEEPTLKCASARSRSPVLNPL
jgi:hypothetical protein